ncbi:MAG TPA: glycosyltransferase family 1 protein [Kiritimatiellia bacterium]|nr:glycosyltransferase family 1 protein [Kiritimatiellia bacterium]
MIRMLNDRARLPTALRNISSARSWRPVDMVNWHRLVAPLRSLASQESAFTVHHVLYDMCTSFDILYQPIATPTRPHPRMPAPCERPRVALFVDAPDHTSGVATTLRQWHAAAEREQAGLCIHYCGFEDQFPGGVRFAPVGTVTLGAYAGLKLCMPQVQEVFRRFEQAPPHVVHLSTPGPMGLLGLAAARRHGIPVVGTFHTDFPSYAEHLSGDPQLGVATWRFMRWFYGQMERVAAPSSDIRNKLIHQGFSPSRVQIVGRGVRTDAFSPEHRDPALRAEWGPNIRHWLLYVGRISREKNLPCLVEAFRLLAARRPDVGLVVVGKGPYEAELREALAGLPVVFAGLRRGEDLARHYASADLFVFPSRTDTFGVVLLEAQASGLPVLVSNDGGPKDAMLPRRTGFIIEPMNPTLLARQAEAVLADEEARQFMGAEARRWAVRQTPEKSFQAFWNLHRSAVVPSTAAERMQEGVPT